MGEWRTPELDDAASEALAVLTLYVTGDTVDARLAGELLDTLTAEPGGEARVIGGTGGLVMVALGLRLALTGRRD